MNTLARHQDPIVAIATAPGRGAVGIVRVSGRGLAPFAQQLLGQALRPRHAHYLPFAAATGEVLDQGLALFFPAPHSYTGEDVLELQAHGGPVVLQLLLARCLEVAAARQPDATALLPGLRLAEPGEFTERAFLNHKLDLAQAEAVADLIDASTEAAARSAGRSLSGAFSQRVMALRERLIHLRMLIEATLDFPEEETDVLQRADAIGQLRVLQQQLADLRQAARQGALLRDGIRVVIVGQPNAGKSSLLNALAGAELAIVTPVAGTTRDTVRGTIQIEGVPLHIVDTAGLRASDDLVEQIGMARAWDEARGADAVLFLRDLSRAAEAGSQAAEAAISAQLAATLGPAAGSQVPVVTVWNKTDAAGHPVPAGDIGLSALRGDGLPALRARLLELAGWQSAPEGLFMARERHVQALADVQHHLEAASGWAESPAPPLDVLAEELRLAQNALNRITGEFGADDLLGVIFSRFCIGK